MMILNTHERILDAPASKVGELIDRLASPDDPLWPKDRWPAIRFDRPLAVGAVGGHGPIGYSVKDYKPGHSICFRFTAPKGFLGTHTFDAEEISSERVRLRHVIEMKTKGTAGIFWLLAVRPLHDALLEDALDRAEAYVASKPTELRQWSLWVRFLRRAMAGISRKR